MNFEEFKDKAMAEIKSRLPKEYEEYEVVTKVIKKVNKVTNVIFLQGCIEKAARPIVYIEELYEMYKNSGSFDDTIDFAICGLTGTLDVHYIEAIKRGIDDYQNRVVFQLVNKEKNQEFLKEVVSRDYLDMAVIYRIALLNNNGNTGSVIVSKKFAENCGVTEDELFEMAYRNTFEKNSFDIRSISEVLRGDTKNIYEDETLLIIASKSVVHGAAAILNTDILKKASDILGGSLHVVCSSVYELLVYKEGTVDVNEMKKIVKDINDNFASESDVLSYSIYNYDKDADKVDIMA